MHRRIFTVSLLLCVCLLNGCLEFGSQTLSYHYDKTADTLRLFQDYHGIFGADAKGDPGKALSEQEQEQLRSVLQGQRTFFFSNWILEFNREGIEKLQADLMTLEGRDKWKMPEAGFGKLEKLLKLLLENVRVENGPFYFDSGKRLCGVQSITLTKCSTVLAAMNDFAPFLFKSLAAEKEEPGEDTPAMLKFAGHPVPVLLLQGNAFTVRWPLSRQSYDETLVANGKAAEFKRAGLNTSFTNDVVTLKLGKPSDSITSLTLTFSTNAPTANLVEPAKSQHTVKEAFDPVAAAKEFLLRKGK